MDGHRFDRLSRVLAAATTRRRALRGVAAVAFGGAGLVAAGADAEASTRTCRPLGAGCTRGSQCCSALCATSRSLPRARRNRCTCGSLSVCNGACVDLPNDAANCGECGVACETEWACASGVCSCGGAQAGDSGEICCDNAWVDPLTDTDHCGGCHQAVPDGGSCVLGKVVNVCPMLDSDNLGDCLEVGNTCTIASDGTLYYYTQASPVRWGCAAETDAPCPSGSFCSLVYRNTSMDAQEVWQSGSDTGLCLEITIPCTPS